MHSGYLPIYRLLPFLVEPGRVLLLRSDQQNRRERFMTHAGRILGIASVLLHLAVASAAQAQSCPHQGLASFGPISAATFGYPAYYVDQNGQGLGQCLDPANPLCGLPPLPDPAAPLDIATGNFFDENLYTFVTADVPMPPNGQPGVPIGLVVYSVLGTFGGPAAAVVPGDQVTFSRIRFRIDTPAAGDYTITHPFGVHVLHAAGPGRRSINFTDDCLLSVPPTCGAASPTGFNAFTTPLAPFSFVSTWLQWDATPPAPPAGFIGDPAVLHTITGSPCGTNFFRVEGPGLPPGGVETNLWSVLGKKASICGNGFLDPGEQCDDGNTLDGDCCSSTCQFEPAGAPCASPTPCLTATTCDGAGVCGGGTPTLAACNDGNACTTADTCAGGVCVGGPPPFCPTNTPLAAVTADTYVQSDLPTTNFGAKTLLAVDNGVAANPGTTGVQRTFLRVNVSGVGPRQITGAHLRLQVAKVTNAQSVSGGRLHPLTDCGWNELTMTWNTQPPIDGAVLATTGAVAQGQVVDFDVTSAIPGDGVYCFALGTLSTDSAIYNSREATVGKPPVSVTAGCPSARGPTTTTTTLAPAPTTTTTLPPAARVGAVVADTYVQSDLPTTNFGAKPQLFVDNGVASNPGTTGVQHTFLRVSVSGVGGSHVTGAHLKLQVASVTNSGSVAGGSIHAITNCSWNELTMTWNTQPAIDGPALATLGAVAAGQLADFDVTPAIPGDGVYCFAIDTVSTDSVIYNSREGSLAHPAVLLTVAP